jgi:hypothetical protein
LLATAIHLDWHIARPAHHHLSLGWTWHWALAIPIFGVAAWLVARWMPERAGVRSAAIIGAAALLGGVLEPAWEYWLGGATFEWAFGRGRNQAFLAFTMVGICAWVAVFALMRRRSLAR